MIESALWNSRYERLNEQKSKLQTELGKLP